MSLWGVSQEQTCSNIISLGTQLILDYYDLMGEEPIDPFPGGGPGGGTGVTTGTGSYGSPSTLDFINLISNPCHMSAIDYILDRSLNSSGKNRIEEILSQMGHDATVNIRVVDSVPSNGAQGAWSRHGYDYVWRAIGGDTTYTITSMAGTIYLNPVQLEEASHEKLVSVFIHEALHGYLEQAVFIPYRIKHGISSPYSPNIYQHTIFAQEYASAMIEFLQETYPHLSNVEANALVWPGISNAMNLTFPIMVDSTSYTLAQLEQIAVEFNTKSGGVHIRGLNPCVNP